MHIPLIKPYLPPGTKNKVNDVLESGYLTEGPVTRELEQTVAEYVGVPHAIAVTSCTTGLELALRVLGIGPGDEVIVPDYTHPGSASVVNIVGARLVLIDIDPQTLLIDYKAAEQAISSRTKAILPVSQFGNPLNYDRLSRLRSEHNLYIIEDAACALGAKYNGQKVGNQADISVFSMHPRKFVTTGEGGIVTTSNSEWAHWMNSYKHFGMDEGVSRRESCFERIGTNYKLSNLQSAVGIVQMREVEHLLQRRLYLAERYEHRLTKDSRITVPQITSLGRHSYQTYCIQVPYRDRVLSLMREKGIEVQIGTYALHQHAAYAEGPLCKHQGSLNNSQEAFETTLALPLFHELSEDEQDAVIRELCKTLDSLC